MDLKALGWARTIRGMREGDQTLVLTGLALVLLQGLRSSRSRRQLIFRKKVPLGSTIVVRHTRRGEPRLDIRQAGRPSD